MPADQYRIVRYLTMAVTALVDRSVIYRRHVLNVIETDSDYLVSSHQTEC